MHLLLQQPLIVAASADAGRLGGRARSLRDALARGTAAAAGARAPVPARVSPRRPAHA
jgi:hypothetical protein